MESSTTKSSREVRKLRLGISSKQGGRWEEKKEKRKERPDRRTEEEINEESKGTERQLRKDKWKKNVGKKFR